MDAFSQIILGTVGYFRQRDDLAEDTRKDITRFVSKTRWLVGIVGTSEGPNPSEEIFHEAAMELTRRLSGRLFTGTEFIIPTQ